MGVNQGGVFGLCFVQAEHGGQDIPFDIDQIECSDGSFLISCGHGGDAISDVSGLIDGQRVGHR